MRIYQIGNDVMKYQYFLPEKEQDARKLTMKCLPQSGHWVPPSVFIYEQLLQQGDFFNFSSSALIFGPFAARVLAVHIQQAGEGLPLPFDGKTYTVLNILQMVKCLDVARTIHELNSGSPYYWKKYAFLPNLSGLLPSSHLFKLSEKPHSPILVWEDDPNVGFIADMKRNQIKGYELTLLWEEA